MIAYVGFFHGRAYPQHVFSPVKPGTRDKVDRVEFNFVASVYRALESGSEVPVT